MRSLIYFSMETQPFSVVELEALHRKCAKNNSSLDITGMLLYKGHNFLQVIEGPEQAIDDLYARIKLDPLHENVVQVVNRPIDHREFAEWKMGFKNLDQVANDNIPGIEGFSNPFINDQFRKETDRAHQLLVYFAAQ